ACFDGVLRIWNVASGKLVTQFDSGVSDEALRLSFSYAPDGSTLASAARNGIALLDSVSLRVKRTLEFPEADIANLNYISLVYAPDGRWLAAALERSIRVWDTVSWESFSLPTVSNVRISFSQDGKSLAVNRWGAGIELWDLATRTKAADLFEPAA